MIANIDQSGNFAPRHTYVTVFGKLLAVRKGKHFADRFIAEGEQYEAYLRDAYDRLLKRDGAFFDVGAQYGFYSLLAMQNSPKRRIIALEPNRDNYAALLDTVRTNSLDCVLPLQCYADTHFSVGSWRGDNDCGSIDKASPDKDAIGIAIDGLEIENVGLVKLDTEGCEGLAIEGMRRTISESKPGLIVEVCERNLNFYGWSIERLFSLIATLGYTKFTLYDYQARNLETQKTESLLRHIKDLDIYGCDVACEMI